MQRILQEIVKKNKTWNIRHLVDESFVPANQTMTEAEHNRLGRWDERLIDQASDVPSIIFFHNFLQKSLQTSFQIIFL